MQGKSRVLAHEETDLKKKNVLCNAVDLPKKKKNKNGKIYLSASILPN